MPKVRGVSRDRVTKQMTIVREISSPVRIRAEADISSAHVNGKYLGSGFHEISEVVPGPGSTAGWGRLVSGEGWIAMDFVEVVEHYSK